MTSPRLPPEVIYAIVTNHLSPNNDIPTYRALSLTHSFLLPATRTALFSTIRLARHVLDDGVHPHLCRSFSTLLRRSPHIAEYVRKLIIVEGTIRNSWFSNMRFWVNSEDEDLPYILRMVAYGGKRAPLDWAGIGLRSLEILGFGKSTVDWNSLHWQMRQALMDVFERGKLEDLRLVGFHNFPLRALRRTHSLRNMCFGWLWTAKYSPDSDSESEDDVYEPTPPPRPSLKFLDLSFENNESQGTALINELSQPNCSINISRLQHLVINGDQHLNLQSLLNHCKNDLRFLEIRTNEYPVPVPPLHINLQALSALHCLSLFVPVIDWEEISPKPFPWLDHLLSTLCLEGGSSTYDYSNPYLHTLQLIFDIDQVPLFDRIEGTEWTSLNAQLLRLLKRRASPENDYSYSPSMCTKGTSIPDLEIRIYIFTDLDGEGYLDCVHDMSVANVLLKDPLASYATTSCRCDDGPGVTLEVAKASDYQSQNIQMRQFLNTFLPVLSTKQGMKSIKVYHVNYIPRL